MHASAMPGRTALLVLGVALGVAVFVAVRALNQTAVSKIGQVGEVAIEDVEGNDAGIAEGAGECVCEGGLAGAGAAGDGD